MTLEEMLSEYFYDDKAKYELIKEIKDYFCKLLEPYIGDDFRAAERTIRNAE